MNNLKLPKIHIINLFIVLLWISFLIINWISYFRLIIFIAVLLIIFIFKIFANLIERRKFVILNLKLLNNLIIFNNFRNPLLYFMIKIDIIFYYLIIKYNNKILNFVIYILCILIINPIKIFHFKLYKVLRIWKDSKIQNIVLNRMLGLILSVLIFANLIIYIKTLLNINYIMIIYLYLLIISILCELIETRSSRLLNIFLVLNIDSKCILRNRLEVNLLSLIFKNSNINELIYYKENITKLDKFQIGQMWYSINSLKLLINKPNYHFYIELTSCLYLYCKRIDTYIFFKYYEWNVPNMDLIDDFNIKDINNLKEIYEYEYKVFKVLLFLYWDLEYYLEDIDYVKTTLMVDSSDLYFLSIKFNINTKSELQFLNKIKYKDSNNFFEKNYLINQLVHKLDLCNYKSLNLSYSSICTLKEICDPINPLYYENYIKEWYLEWHSEINKDLNLKYKEKISNLELDYDKLFNNFKF